MDDDLESVELNGFLEHLFACEPCRQELKAFETLRQGFRKADLLDSPPEPRRTCSLGEARTRTKPRAGAVPLAQPVLEEAAAPARPGIKPGRSREDIRGGSLWRFAFPQSFLRYAVPLILLVIVGIRIYPERAQERIDVRTLPTSHAMAGHLAWQDEETENMRPYVMDHATLQPWAHYGSHLPMIQTVAGSHP